MSEKDTRTGAVCGIGQSELPSDVGEVGSLILGMRAAFARGENAMEWARRHLGLSRNTTSSTLIGYDLQAGSYTRDARLRPEQNAFGCQQMADILNHFCELGGGRFWRSDAGRQQPLLERSNGSRGNPAWPLASISAGRGLLGA